MWPWLVKSWMGIGETSNVNDTVASWKLIWHLRIPLKVKHFLWKAFKNMLPAREVLYRKGISNVVVQFVMSPKMFFMHWYFVPLHMWLGLLARWAFILIVFIVTLLAAGSRTWCISLIKNQIGLVASVAWGI